jgi:hypothetical protein
MMTVQPQPANHEAQAGRATGPEDRHQSVITVRNGENGGERWNGRAEGGAIRPGASTEPGREPVSFVHGRARTYNFL